ncbi:hypothetical protein A0J61_03450 [Choanephora cucurbitarum]|uniref:Uncharacterized protein n=1 Tax=Choanephora cucurbitarum TaxID=101091 RepID=A0A1C7NIA3_9FUNG|nr:hypothetical protein A0J61_03450 [Choanephora cucurbitarum]
MFYATSLLHVYDLDYLSLMNGAYLGHLDSDTVMRAKGDEDHREIQKSSAYFCYLAFESKSFNS